MRRIIILIGCLLAFPGIAAGGDDGVPPGPFSDEECLACHQEREPEIIEAWQDGPHGGTPGAGCSGCHGDRHGAAAAKARSNRACTGCHQGPAGHSYATSKHGVITRLEERSQDWRQPLQRGRYRAPGCSYCHLHGNDHGDTMAPGRGPTVRQWICAGCHSPRYVREQFAAGERLLEIAGLKVAEGEALIAATSDLPGDAVAKLRQGLLRHLENVRLGAGHQSPDYQWWHGQPALDGDLIRIRDAVAEAGRRQGLADSTPMDQ